MVIMVITVTMEPKLFVIPLVTTVMFVKPQSPKFEKRRLLPAGLGITDTAILFLRPLVPLRRFPCKDRQPVMAVRLPLPMGKT